MTPVLSSHFVKWVYKIQCVDIRHIFGVTVSISVNNGNCFPWGARVSRTGGYRVVQAAEKAPPVCRLLEGFSSDRQACRTPLVHVPNPPLVPNSLIHVSKSPPGSQFHPQLRLSPYPEEILRVWPPGRARHKGLYIHCPGHRSRSPFTEAYTGSIPPGRLCKAQTASAHTEGLTSNFVRSRPRCRIQHVYVLYTKDNELYTPSHPSVHID